MSRPAGPPYGERVLQLDPPCQGLDVWELQIKLIGWGSGSNNNGIGSTFMPVKVTGTFDVTTSDAVKRFQQAAGLPLTGIVDSATFQAIDREAGLYAVMVHTMQCPCIKPDPIPIQCRCTDHHKKGICDGFGHGLFAGKFLLDGVKLPDGTSLAGEKFDVYDMEEYPGIDKALIWAVRALMRRANVNRIKVVAGYRCWQDNYRHTDHRRWRHRRATFHFGKSMEFYHDGTCVRIGQDPTHPVCNICVTIRQNAIDLCGFQPRWQEPDRVSLADVADNAPAPANKYAVHVSTVRRREREKDEFVKTFADSVRPVYEGKAPAYSYPVDLGGGLDWRYAPSLQFFDNTESGAHGWFPFGPNRLWHTGVHLFRAAGTQVHAIADGEVIACRAGENEAQHTLGSRNFVLLRHKWKDKTWYSLYLHLDNGAIGAAAVVGGAAVEWRRKAHLLTLLHVEMKLPSPQFDVVNGGTANSYLGGRPGLGPGEWAEAMGGAAASDPRTLPAPNPLDPLVPQNSTVVQMAVAGNPYLFLTLDGEELGRLVPANAAIAAPIANHTPFALPSPIPVRAGELLGAIGQTPTDAVLNPHGAYLHLETFSTEPLLSGPGYTLVDAADITKLMDRKATYQTLQANNLVSAEPADVLLQSDVAPPGIGINRGACRSVVLKTWCPWEPDWKTLLNASPSFTFMKDNARDTMGNEMLRYRWWADVAAGASLPPPQALYYHHPVALMLQLAYG